MRMWPRRPVRRLTAGPDIVYGHKSFDAAVDAYEEPAEKVPFNRMEPHDGVVLPTPHLAAIYVDYPEQDALLTWIITATDYWSILAQYGVGYGTFVGSASIPTATFFQPGDITNGLVDAFTVEQRVHEAVHGMSDAGVPVADAYIVFLGMTNVSLDGDLTCGEVGGYHDTDGAEPFALIPPGGRALAISHELAEMCTDPYGTGWYSDADVMNAGGEVGDLCNYAVGVDAHNVTGLWSNKDGDCEPQP